MQVLFQKNRNWTILWNNISLLLLFTQKINIVNNTNKNVDISMFKLLQLSYYTESRIVFDQMLIQ